MRILVAEDDRFVREVLGVLLTAWGHSPHLAANGEEALAAYRAEHFPIVISDWFMPDMSGGGPDSGNPQG